MDSLPLAACRLPLPDRFGGYSIEVDQCRWGHLARKRTWLYIVGVDPALIVLPPWFDPVAVIDCSSGRKGQGRGVVHLPKGQRHITPPAFAKWLVNLAATVRR